MSVYSDGHNREVLARVVEVEFARHDVAHRQRHRTASDPLASAPATDH